MGTGLPKAWAWQRGINVFCQAKLDNASRLCKKYLVKSLLVHGKEGCETMESL
jgi:hypothetical protein